MQKSTIINNTSEPCKKKMKCERLLGRLTKKMKDEIIKGERLNDQHINLAQTLLKKQFPTFNGLQNCLFSQKIDNFQPVEGDAIQIHFVSPINHWVTSCSKKLENEVAIYDSSFSKGEFEHTLQEQLAVIYNRFINFVNDSGDEMDPTLIVATPGVQQQKGIDDCGLFAIAFALHLALGHDVAKIVFAQSEMRSHLVKCYQMGYFEPFPHKKVDRVLPSHHFFCRVLQLPDARKL